MKNHTKQGRSKYLLIIVTILISLLALTFVACNGKIDVASIDVVADSVPQNVRVSEFDITKVALEVTDSSGNVSQIFATPTMLTTESRNKLTQAGEHSITLQYQQKQASFIVTIYENDAELVTVTFKDKNSNIIANVVTLKGGSVTPPSHPVIEGMRASGWADGPNSSAAATLTNVNNSIEVYAKYNEDIQLYTVTFKDYQGNQLGIVQVPHNSIISDFPTYNRPDGIKDVFWRYGNSDINETSFKVTNNITIGMRVEYITYSVTFMFKDIDGETEQLYRETVEHGKSATGANDARTELTRKGYNFIKWLAPFNNVKMDLTIEAEAAINSFEVIFLDHSGSEITRQQVNYGDNATPPSGVGTKTGFTFTGNWDGSLLNVRENRILTAEYTPRPITITVYDGTSELITRNYGTIITADNLGEIKQKPGNILLGIYSDAGLNNIFELPYMITVNTSFYTKWVDTINGNSELMYSEISVSDNTRNLISYNGNDSIIYIPDLSSNASVVRIESGVFMNKDIIKVVFGSNIKTIGVSAFENTKLAGTVVLPSGLETIGARAFAGCKDLESVVIPASVTSIDASAFEGATKLSSIIFANVSLLTHINNRVFFGCESLSNISLPATVTKIGDSAFEGSGLTAINVSNVTEIGVSAFKDCQKLVVISGTSKLETIKEYALSNTAITNITLSAISELGEYAFAESKKLVTVVLGSSLEQLNAFVFNNCTKLTTLNFLTETVEDVLKGMKTISDFAFLNCSNLNSISLPTTLLSIGADAFDGTLKLTSILIDDENDSFSTLDGVLYNKDSSELIAYPSGKIAAQFIVPETVLKISKNAFRNATIAKLVIASSVNELQENSLNSRGISSIQFMGEVPSIINGFEEEMSIINDSLWKLYVSEEFIDNYLAINEFDFAEITPSVINSLYDASSGLSYIIVSDKIRIVAANRLLTSITVPASINGKAVTHILSYAFENCDALTSLQINANLVELGEFAFKGCVALNNINFASIQRATINTVASIINLNAFTDTPWYKNRSLVVIADTAFEYKFVLDAEGNPIDKKSLVVPNGVEVLYNDLFNNAAGNMLETISLPQSLIIIRENAFKNAKITSITIPNSVTTIASGAFENCASLTVINIGSSVVSIISETTFKGCSSLKEIVLPSSVTQIKAEAFMDCSSLIKITLPNLLVSIGARAFKNCSSLPIISIPSRVGEGIALGNIVYGDEAFAGCDSLVYIRIWNRNPAALGLNVFGSAAFIYVESSDGAIITNYQETWSAYALQIKDQKDSPVISFVTNKDINGQDIPAMSGIKVDDRKVAVLYDAPILPSITGYLFVTWTYNVGGVWVPVEYPFLAPQSVTLRAKWVKTDEGSLTESDLTYNSAMNGYILTSYNGADTKVVIPAYFKGYPIIAIADGVFNGKNNITDIIFPSNSSIRLIGNYAFANMLGITQISFPASIIDIGNYAFAYSTNLETVYIRKNVMSIGEFAFASCSLLDITFEGGSELRYTQLNTFADTLWYLNKKADDEANFVIAGRLVIEYIKQENQNLVTLPISVIAVRKELFAGDDDLVSIELHSDIQFIGDRAFYNCTSLINVDFGSSEQSKINFVGVDAFTGTPWKISQDEFVLVGTVLVRYEGTNLNVQIPNYVTVIDKDAFAFKAIENVRLPNNLKKIADRAFFSCSNLESIEIPSQVTFIGNEAFSNNVSLKSIVFLGNNVEEIGDRAFYGCTSLGTDITKPHLVMPSSLSKLGSGVFEGCSALTNVSLQNTALTTLRSRTFYGANNLNTVILAPSIQILENDVFAGCTVLENITAGSNSQLKEIGTNALTGTQWYNRSISAGENYIIIYLGRVLLKYRQSDSEKRNIVIPEQVRYIAESAFEDSSIASITFPSGLLEIGNFAFAGCEFLTSVTIPNSVLTIGEYSFANCQRLETANLGSGLLKVEASAFSGSSNLTKLVVNKMGYGALSDDQITEASIAIAQGAASDWFEANPNVFEGTDLINVNAFYDTSSFLRIYVVADSQNINIEIYRHYWAGVSTRLYNTGELPTVSFVNVVGASPLSPLSTELLIEGNIHTVYSGNTLLGWEAVISPEDTEGVRISFPYKVVRDTILRPIWLNNNRPINDTFLGFNYTPNASSTAYLISNFTSTSETMVIASRVNGYPLIGVNTGVFTEANTANVKTVIITQNDGLATFDFNIFRNFINLEKIIINGSNSRFVAVDGVLFTSDMKTLVAFPRAKKGSEGFVTSYNVPSSVDTILAYAFAGSKLQSLFIPVSVKTIGEAAFQNNFALVGSEYVGLTSITFGPGSELQNVAYGAFDGSAWYKLITSQFRVAGSYLLSYNGYEANVTIPSTVKTVGIRAFENGGLNNIAQLIIPTSVVKINQDAFANCSNIVSIIFNSGSSLMDVANDVFVDTSWIDVMSLDASEFIVAGNVLINYKGGRDYLPLPNEIKVIGYNAFNNARFSSITLHNGLERIDEKAFYGCDNLTSITIPASVKQIGNFAFYSCLELTTITFAGNSNLSSIGNSAFGYNSKLKTIVIPDTVKEVGSSAFANCLVLEDATFNPTSQLVELGQSAFKNAKKLKSIFIPDGLKEIKTSTFEDCEALLTVNFSNMNRRLTTIGEYAFRNCILLGSDLDGKSSLLTVELPYNVNVIKDGAFFGNTKLRGIKMQGQIISIGANAFYNCSGLTNVTITTAQPPVVQPSSFNFSAHQKLRVYVNLSQNQTVLNAYKSAWGGEIVASTSKIFERGLSNLPLVQIFDYNTVTGLEEHLAVQDFRAEFLSAARLPVLTKGGRMSTGFYKSSTFENQVCTPNSPFEIIQDDVLKLYVRWET